MGEGSTLHCAFLEGCTQEGCTQLRQEVQVMILIFRVAIHGNFPVSPTTKGKSVVNPCLSLSVERLTTTALAVSVYPDPVPVKLKLLKL